MILLFLQAVLATQGPIIGILSTTPGKYKDIVEFHSGIELNYAMFVATGGGRPLALPMEFSQQKLQELFWKTNGILFTGGPAYLTGQEPDTITEMTEKACFLLDLVIKANQKGIYMPLLGVCQGHQIIHLCLNNNKTNTLGEFKGEPLYSQKLEFKQEAYTSKFFTNSKSFYQGQKALFNLGQKALAPNFHQNGIEPSLYESSEKVSDFFQILAISKDLEGKEFVSISESKKFPVYSIQFHPEKNLFTQNIDEVDHSSQSIQIAQYISRFLIDEARNNENMFEDEQGFNELDLFNFGKQKLYFGYDRWLFGFFE